MYQILRSILFLFDAEKVHHFSMNALRRLCNVAFIRKILAKKFKAESLKLKAFGFEFSNPVGLAAGFDKNAKYLRELEILGFGHVEIGTVTPRPQAGNDKPRLFRLPEDKALLNRMGFNNDGVEVVAERLEKWKKARDKAQGTSYKEQVSDKAQSQKLVLGGNIGKNKDTPNEYAYLDYDKCFRALHPYVDYFVVNVSSPNTPGLRELQEKESLRKILTHLQGINVEQATGQRPILLKIAPDLTQSQLDDVIDLAQEIKLDGLVAANTTLDRTKLSDAGKIRAAEAGAGGVSGKPVQARSTEMVQYIHQKTNGSIPIIASGGIFTAEDAKEKLDAGATLVQVWTGFIYEGPSIVEKICAGLSK